MNLAILGTRGIPARYGGFETFAEKLAIELNRLGHQVTVYCEDGNTPELAVYKGVRLRHVPTPRLGPLHTIVYDTMSLWDARKSFDVVYVLGYSAAAFFFLPRLWGTKVWINPDGLEWARAKWNRAGRLYLRFMEWLAVRTVDRVITDSEAIAEHLASRHGKLPACITIPYGCEAIETAPPVDPLWEWALAPESYYLVVCRLEPENHVLEILRAFRQSQSARELIVVGDRTAQTLYVEQLLAVGDPRIRMIGTVYDQQKLSSLRYHAYAYLHGHSVGGTNPSLLEAMGCGNFIFAHDNAFNRETLGDAGVYFANAADLTKAIDRAEHETLEEMREAARKRARSRYGWSNVIASYAALLEDVERQLKAA